VLLRKVADELAEFGTIEQSPNQEGRNMIMVMAPVKAPPRKHDREPVREGDAAAATDASVAEAAPAADVAPAAEAAPAENSDASAEEAPAEAAPEQSPRAQAG
jgi:translation initiation factor IF-3